MSSTSSFTVAQNNRSAAFSAPPGTLVVVSPSSGATALVEYTSDTAQAVASNSAVWYPWAKGTVSASTYDQTTKALWVRVSASGGSTTVAVTEGPQNAQVANVLPDWQSSNKTSYEATGNTVVILSDSRGQMCQKFYSGAEITSITRSGNVVTCVVNSHGMATGTLIRVLKAFPQNFNGEFSITRVDANTFTYASTGADGSATITAASIVWRSYLSGRGFYLYLNALLGGRLKLVKNLSVGGDTTSDMLSRVRDVIATGATWCIDFGFYNDLSNLTTAQTIANKLAIYTQLLGAGMQVIACTETPLSGSGSKYSAANNEQILAVNRWMRTFAQSTKGMVLADPYRLVVDAANTATRGVALSGMIDTDNVHIVGRGQYFLGKSIYNAVNALIPTQSPLVSSAAETAVAGVNNYNAIDLAPWAGSGGTVSAPASGTACGGITVELGSGAGTTCVASAITRSDGGFNQQIVVTPAALESWNIRSNTGGTILTRLTAGEYRRLIADISVAWTTFGTLTQVYLAMVIVADGVTYTTFCGNGVVSANAINDGTGYAGTFVSEPIQIPSGTISNVTWRLTAEFSGASANTATIQIGRVSFVQTTDLPA